MSWVEFVPARPAGKQAAAAPVTLAVSKAGRFVQRGFLTVQPGLVDWWINSGPVRVQLGQDANAGRLRVSRGGPLAIMAPTGKGLGAGRANAPTLQLAGLPGVPENGLPRRPVDWEVVDGALIVTLPWSGAKGATKTGPQPAPPPAVAAAPAKAVMAAEVPPAAVAPPAPLKPAPAAPKPLPVTVARAAAPPPASAKSPVSRGYAEIEAWAISRNLGSPTHGFDLAKVNQKRIAEGLAPFVISKTRGGA